MDVPFGPFGISSRPLVIDGSWEAATFEGIIWQRHKPLHEGVQEIGWGRVSRTVCLVSMTVAKVLIKTSMLTDLSVMKWELLQGKGV